MKCVHEIERQGISFCDMDACEQCIAMHPEHQYSNCQYFATLQDQKDEAYITSLTEEKLDEILKEVA